MSRRSLLFGATFAGGASLTGLLSACNWVTSEPATVSPTATEAPANPPATATPVPDESDPNDSTMTPTPTQTPATVEQVLRIGGDLREVIHASRDPQTECIYFPGIQAGLLEIDEDLDVQADWAEVWAPNDVGETWMFQIRRNERGWTGGTPVTAHDFVSAWRRLLDPERQNPDAWRLFDIQNAREVYAGERPLEDLGAFAPDDWSLEVSLERPRYSFPALAGSSLLMPEAGPVGTDPARCDSNGPYSYMGEDDDVLTLTRHEDYWFGTGASLDRVEINAEGPAQSLDRFRSGDLDIVWLAPADVPRVRSDAELRSFLHQGIPTSLTCLVPQVEIPPFDDDNVRRALGLLIDRERLELIVEGRVIAARRLMAEGLFPSLDEASAGTGAAFDVDTGLELIDSSAYPDPEEWPEFGLVIPQGDSYMERVARDLSAQLAENLGITVPVDLVPLDEYRDGLREHRFPLTWVEWPYRYADPACAYTDLFASWLNPQRPAAWADADYDDLVRVADSLVDPLERAEIYSQCEELLQELGIYTPLVHPVDYFLVQSWVEDVPRDNRGRIMPSVPFHTRFTTGVSVTRRT